MSRSRSGSGQRVPSPAVTRRRLLSHDLSTSLTDRHLHDPRLLSREASPRGFGRVSTSAPPSAAGTPRSFSRRYAGHDDVISDVIIPVPDFVSSPYTSRSRESSPRTRMTSSVVHYVKGDVSAARPRPGLPRHKSFPEYPPYVHFSQSSSLLPPPPPPPASSPHDPRRRRDPSPAGVMTRLQVTGQGSEDQASVSPPSSDEAASRSSVTTARGEDWGGGEGKGGEGLEESMTSEEGWGHQSYSVLSSVPVAGWLECLRCALCGQLYRRPRILPCGHTFCTDCLVQLKNESLQEDPRSPGGHVTCHLTEGRGRPRPSREWGGGPRAGSRGVGTEVGAGAQLACPVEGCGQSLRLLNLGRWTIRNKAVSQAVTALRAACDSRQDACTQTDIGLDSALLTIPRSLLGQRPSPLRRALAVGGGGGVERRGDEEGESPTVVDRVVHRALSMDCLSRHYLPPQHLTWRACLAMMGMTVLDQVLH